MKITQNYHNGDSNINGDLLSSLGNLFLRAYLDTMVC